MSVEILTTKEACTFLRISRGTLAAYEREGLIACVRYPSLAGDKPRRTRLYRREALEAFLSGHENGHKDEIESAQVIAKADIPKRGLKKNKNENVHWLQQYARR